MRSNNNAVKNLLPLAALLAIVVDGSADYVQKPISLCSSQEGMAASLEKNATMISEPHKYFPTQIKHIVDAANANSPDAIGLPDDQSYPVIDISPRGSTLRCQVTKKRRMW